MPRSIAKRPPLQGVFRAPGSKPETQRALIMGTLADGRTSLHSPLVSRETELMADACRALGAEITRTGDRIDIVGADPWRTANGTGYVWAGGSALIARVCAVIGSALPGRLIVDGTCSLRERPFGPLFEVLAGKGVGFLFPGAPGRPPFATLSDSLPGGRYDLDTTVSSQFATALLIAAPLAADPLRLRLRGPLYSMSYIRQTVEMMSRFGVPVQEAPGMRELTVPGGKRYQARTLRLTGDYTSASYLMGAAAVTRGRVTVTNLDPHSAQGERTIVGILTELGARVHRLDGDGSVTIDCGDLTGAADADFDLRDCPNILPTVAAVAATVPGRIRITGGRLTQHHKSPRIAAMATELHRVGIPVALVTDREGTVDGLDIRGRVSHEGDADFSDHGDHRILMATVLLGLAGRRPCRIGDAADTADSFPAFMNLLDLDAEVFAEER
ncbi:hypothetical protein [Nonomuraea sp. NPDC049141]|uniref:3-phosphoshikimate 1-carboxyvinyltransferase n=1 Tax=unclassified Nonomuraea TaxID=2593643 RepID=UPI0033FF9117